MDVKMPLRSEVMERDFEARSRRAGWLCAPWLYDDARVRGYDPTQTTYTNVDTPHTLAHPPISAHRARTHKDIERRAERR